MRIGSTDRGKRASLRPFLFYPFGVDLAASAVSIIIPIGAPFLKFRMHCHSYGEPKQPTLVHTPQPHSLYAPVRPFI